MSNNNNNNTVVRRLSDEEVSNIFQCLTSNTLPSIDIKFQIVKVGPKGMRLSPPSYEFQDGLYILLQPEKKNTKVPEIPSKLVDLIYKPDIREDIQECPWSLSGPQFPMPCKFQQRYCYPKGEPTYSNRKGGALWTKCVNGKEDTTYRLLHVYHSSKRESNKEGVGTMREKAAKQRRMYREHQQIQLSQHPPSPIKFEQEDSRFKYLHHKQTRHRGSFPQPLHPMWSHLPLPPVAPPPVSFLTNQITPDQKGQHPSTLKYPTHVMPISNDPTADCRGAGQFDMNGSMIPFHHHHGAGGFAYFPHTFAYNNTAAAASKKHLSVTKVQQQISSSSSIGGGVSKDDDSSCSDLLMEDITTTTVVDTPLAAQHTEIDHDDEIVVKLEDDNDDDDLSTSEFNSVMLEFEACWMDPLPVNSSDDDDDDDDVVGGFDVKSIFRKDPEERKKTFKCKLHLLLEQVQTKIEEAPENEQDSLREILVETCSTVVDNSGRSVNKYMEV